MNPYPLGGAWRRGLFCGRAACLIPFGSCRESYTLSKLEIGGKKMKYRVHRFNIKMTKDQDKLEQFLNSLEGEVVAIIPNVAPVSFSLHAHVDFLLIVEKVG
jgi:hypothetical protein